MTAVTIGELLDATDTALQDLRRRYAAINQRCPDSPLGMLAGILCQREANTITAIAGYRTREEHHRALDVNVRLGGGFPLTDLPRVPQDPQVEQLIAVAEETDRSLEHLQERVELYAASAEVHATFDAIDALVRQRRKQLASALRELDELVPDPTDQTIEKGRRES